MALEITAFAVDPACILGIACILLEKTVCIPQAEDTACMVLVDNFACKLPAGNMAALLLFGRNFQPLCLVVLLSLPPQNFP